MCGEGQSDVILVDDAIGSIGLGLPLSWWDAWMYSLKSLVTSRYLDNTDRQTHRHTGT